MNGRVVREVTGGVPDEPMTLRFNIWAPSADFPLAFDGSLQLARSAAEGQSMYYEVDLAEILRQ